MGKTKAMYAGSFDPFTNGHLAIVSEASKIFDEVVVCISVNSAKKRGFSDVKMKASMEKCFEQEGLSNCRVLICSGMVADECQKLGIGYLVRGLRNAMDYNYEENIAKINREINPDLVTVYFRADKNEIISSSMVKELHTYGKPIDKYVPKEILTLINKEEKAPN